MKHKAQKINSEEWVEGWYALSLFDIPTITNLKGNRYRIKPETLQIQITSTGEWVNVDDVQIIAKVCECDYPLVRSGYCGNCQRDLI